MKTKVSDISVENEFTLEKNKPEFVPAMRSGAWSDVGSRSTMEDVYLCLDNFMDSYGLKNSGDGPSAFYAVNSFFAYLDLCILLLLLLGSKTDDIGVTSHT